MTRKTFFFSIWLLLLAIPASICWGLVTSSGSFLPLPVQKQYDAKIAELGKKLFHDARLSKDNQVACSNCHINQLNGVDSRPKAIGPDNMIANFNTPSLYNATLLYKLFWEGKETDINKAIYAHIQDPTIMAGKWSDITDALSNDIAISEQFNHAFKDGLTDKNVVTTLVNYLGSLDYTPSRFDAYLKGDLMALNQEEKIGLKKFIDLGCHLCHQGKLLGKNLIMPLGIIYPYPDNPYKKKHLVPSLRNVTKTAPYFHDGSISTLEDAIKIMAKYQVGVDIKDNDVNSIVLFLKTLESTLVSGADDAP
jgi:cytochrome c peroxidase